MTDTSQAEEASGQPQTNGFADDGLDDDERGKMRPADIDADVREMERRKRVEMIMNSRLFREELERIIESQMKEGGSGPGGLLQQLSDMMGPGVGRLQSANMFRSPNCVVPINDIRGVESMGYAKGEKLLRCKLAAVYRLIDLYGWTQGIHNHITARLNQDEEQFLVNPWGMLYHEVTASSLVKVDMQGNTVEGGTTNFGVNREGFKLHAAIHSARPDIKCIIHTHTSSVVAVSSLKTGLLPLCHEALVIGEVSTHQYVGGIFDPEEQEKIARNLGPINKVLFLTNHGAVCCGETVEEAFFNVYNTVQACDTQVKLMPLGIDNLVLLPDESRKRVHDAARRPPEGHVLDKDKEVTSPTVADRKEKRWRVGGTEFEALMRMLDNAGFRTGYIYRNPLVKGDPPRPRNDIEVPPAVSSLGYLLEEEELYKQGGWKKFGKTHDRTRWLNSPNVYQKVEILETGTPDPKKITKWVDANADEWVADGSPTHSSTPVKINTLQFVPKNTNPKEFKKLQQQIKDNRRADKITSGPQSHILEGVSWEEAKKMQDANISQTGDQVILVGAASKGIIQRGFQHNAMVYKAPYAKNPFDTVTEEELEEYKRAVDRKARGEHYDDSESEALSSSAAARPPTGKSPTSPTSETEEESRDEHRVLRIETKQAPRPIQAEVVLSDDSDYPDAIMERSKSARFPTKATPDLVTVPSGIGRSWSLGRNKRSNKADSQASSLPGLNTALRHFHHARYVTLPVCEGPARPASPCSITRFSAVPEPSSRATGPVTFHYPYPSYPTLSMSSLRSSAKSISSSLDSLADDLSIPCGGSASSVSRSEMLSETVRARLTELPRADRVVVAKLLDGPKGEGSTLVLASQDIPIQVQLDETDTTRSRSSLFDCKEETAVSDVTVIVRKKSEEADAEKVTEDGQVAGNFIRGSVDASRCFTKDQGLDQIEGENLRSPDYREMKEKRESFAKEVTGVEGVMAKGGNLSECEEQTCEGGVQEDTGDEKDDTVIFQGKGALIGKWEEEIADKKSEENFVAGKGTVGKQESCEDFAVKNVASENVSGKEGLCQDFAKADNKGKDTARERVDIDVAEKMEALADAPKEEQTGAEEKEECADSAKDAKKGEVASETASKVIAEREVYGGDIAKQVEPCEDAEENCGFFTKVVKNGQDTAEEDNKDIAKVEDPCQDVAKEKEVSEGVAKENVSEDAVTQEEERGFVEKGGAREHVVGERVRENSGEESKPKPIEEKYADTSIHEKERDAKVDKEEQGEAIPNEEKETDISEDEEEEYDASDDEENKAIADKKEECHASSDEEGMHDGTTDEEECNAVDYEEEESDTSGDEEEQCEAIVDEEEECDTSADEEQEYDASANEKGECDTSADEDEEFDASADEEEECAASADEEEECETVADEEEECDASEDQEEECETTADEEEECAASADEEEECETVADEEEECDASEDQEEECETTADEENECDTSADQEEEYDASADQEENYDASADQEEDYDESADQEDEYDASLDQEEKYDAPANEEEWVASTDEIEKCGATADDELIEDIVTFSDSSKDSAKDQREDLAGECGDLSGTKEKITVVARREECATSTTKENLDNPAFICDYSSSISGEKQDNNAVASPEDEEEVTEEQNDLNAENASSNRKRRNKRRRNRRRQDTTISKDNYCNDKRNQSEKNDNSFDEEFSAEGVGTFNDLTFVCESLGIIDKPKSKDESYKHFNDLIMEAVSAACNATVDDEYRESFPRTVCHGLDDENVTLPTKEDNLLWDFSDMALWDEASDDEVSFHGASESLSSSKSFHFGEGTPKVAAAFWDRGSLPFLNADFPTVQGDDTVSVTSWVDGEQYFKEEATKRQTEADDTHSSGEANDLEWSGVFTENNTYDERSWNRRDRRRAVSCGSEGGKEALFDLKDAPPSDPYFSPFSSPDAPFYSPVSPSYFNNSQGQVEPTPALSSRRRSSSVGDLVPENTFHFSWNSSKDVPKVSVTQTVSLTGSLTNKRVDVETTVVSERDGGKCVVTKVSCSPAGVVRGRLFESNAKSSPLELGRVFTLKKRRNADL